MSSIGPSSPAALNLAGSFAGAQQTTAHQDETKAQQAVQKFQAEQTAADEKDVAEADLDADRDADGRQSLAGFFHEADELEESRGEDAASADPSVKHPPDAFGIRGGQLDIDA